MPSSYDFFVNIGQDNIVNIPCDLVEGDSVSRITFSKRRDSGEDEISEVTLGVSGEFVVVSLPASVSTYENFPCHYDLYVLDEDDQERKTIDGRVLTQVVAASSNDVVPGIDVDDEGKLLGVDQGVYSLMNIDGGFA